MVKANRDNAPTLARDQSGHVMGVASPGACQQVSFNNSAGDAVQSTAFTSTVIRIVSTADCFYAIGANPTAVPNGASHFLPSGVPYDWEVTVGHKISVVDADASSAAAGEVLYITELT